MSRYLVLNENDEYIEVLCPFMHDHYYYDYHTDIYYEQNPGGLTKAMIEQLKTYGIEDVE